MKEITMAKGARARQNDKETEIERETKQNLSLDGENPETLR